MALCYREDNRRDFLKDNLCRYGRVPCNGFVWRSKAYRVCNCKHSRHAPNLAREIDSCPDHCT